MPTEDGKRLMEFEVQLHGSSSTPLGLAVLNNGKRSKRRRKQDVQAVRRYAVRQLCVAHRGVGRRHRIRDCYTGPIQGAKRCGLALRGTQVRESAIEGMVWTC
jgi:hypothetical protein